MLNFCPILVKTQNGILLNNTLYEPIIIKRNEPKSPSKFKKFTTFQENTSSLSKGLETNKEEIQDDKKEDNKKDIIKEQKEETNKEEIKEKKEENDKDKTNKTNNDFLNKVNMFQNKGIMGSPGKKPKMEKKVTINESPSPEKKEADKSKEQRMNKAMQRIKKKRSEKSEESAKHEQDDPMFKSVRIKNMAQLLENQMNKSMPSGEINNNNKEIKQDQNNEDDAFDKMVSMLEKKPGKVVFKKKMSKRKFED